MLRARWAPPEAVRGLVARPDDGLARPQARGAGPRRVPHNLLTPAPCLVLSHRARRWRWRWGCDALSSRQARGQGRGVGALRARAKPAPLVTPAPLARTRTVRAALSCRSIYVHCMTRDRVEITVRLIMSRLRSHPRSRAPRARLGDIQNARDRPQPIKWPRMAPRAAPVKHATRAAFALMSRGAGRHSRPRESFATIPGVVDMSVAWSTRSASQLRP